MVGRQRQHDRIRIALQAPSRPRRRSPGPNRAAPARAPPSPRSPSSAAWRWRKKAEIGRRHHDRRGEQGRVGDPQQRLLIGRTLAHQRQKLLRHSVARDRPQTRAGAAGEQQRDDQRVGQTRKPRLAVPPPASRFLTSRARRHQRAQTGTLPCHHGGIRIGHCPKKRLPNDQAFPLAVSSIRPSSSAMDRRMSLIWLRIFCTETWSCAIARSPGGLPVGQVEILRAQGTDDAVVHCLREVFADRQAGLIPGCSC